MTGNIEREIGGLRADVQNLVRSVDRLTNKLDGHVDDDNRRFKDLYRWRDRMDGGHAKATTMRATAFSVLGLIGGGLGAWLSKWFGGN